MKTKFIILSLVIFALAAASLTTMQVIQTNKTMVMSTSLFTINVNNTMDEVIDQLNRMKVEDYISQKDRYKLLKLKRIEDLNSKMDQVIRDNSTLFYDSTRISFATAFKDSAVIIPGAKLSDTEQESINRYNTLLGARTRLTNGSEFYDHFVDDISRYIVANLMSNSNFNYQLLDSLICDNLLANGIDIKPVMGVMRSNSKEFIYCNAEGKESILRDSPYSYSFSPSGIGTSADYYIMLYFPPTLLFLRDTNRIFLLSSLILIIIIGIIFIMSIRTILIQRRLDEMKNDFIGNMTHEIKTPITNIGLACEMLNIPDVSKDEAARSNYIDMISKENKRMLMLVQTILQSSKMSSKNYQLNISQIDVNRIINETVSSFMVQIQSKHGQLHLNLEADPATINADEMHITNLIYNLIDNAIKYSPNELDITLSTQLDGPNMIIKIQDHGLGISKEDQKHVFEKFFRVSTGNVHNVKGFGIGLNYVHRVVETHDGTISVDSNLGEGTTFTISLPRQ